MIKRPNIMLATLCLNEMQWLDKLWKQHKEWEGANIVEWVFVEAADRVYAETNPHLVNDKGLSIDGTTEYLRELEQKEKGFVTHIRHGFTSHTDKAQGKCEARNRYLEVADCCRPDYIVILDADEFWPKKCQAALPPWINTDDSRWGFSTPHREIWHPPSVDKEPLFKYEVRGGFWDMLYCRVWKWIEGMRYSRNHNTPCTQGGYLLDHRMRDYRKSLYIKNTTNQLFIPYFVHMGFASNPEMRQAKNRYYRDRGEEQDKRRKWYCDSRDCFNTWNPGDILPKDASVVPYTGIIPEAFIEQPTNTQRT